MVICKLLIWLLIWLKNHTTTIPWLSWDHYLQSIKTTSLARSYPIVNILFSRGLRGTKFIEWKMEIWISRNTNAVGVHFNYFKRILPPHIFYLGFWFVVWSFWALVVCVVHHANRPITTPTQSHRNTSVNMRKAARMTTRHKLLIEYQCLMFIKYLGFTTVLLSIARPLVLYFLFFVKTTIRGIRPRN